MKILIAEDDYSSRMFLKGFLSRYGECDMVVDGLEALDAFLISVQENEPYDMVCLDIMMPKVDGVRVLKSIRDYETQKGLLPERRTKVIITTALAKTQSVRNALEIGYDAYIEKPIKTEELVDTMKKLQLITDK